ncbi:MAG: hypothetical protein M3315_10235 [Actinomycetota bacterium]|nr:hypothetical protein [Actinomycetota bacterium]
MNFIDVRDNETGRLLFRYDPERDVIQVMTERWDRHKRQRVKASKEVSLATLRRLHLQTAR